MSDVKVTGSINMDLLHLSDAQGAQIVEAKDNYLALKTAAGAIRSYPDVSPSLLTGYFSLNGAGLTYDTNGQLNGGTVTWLDYSISGTGGVTYIDLHNVSFPASQLTAWLAADATQTFLSTVLSGNDSIESWSDRSDSTRTLLRGFGGNDIITGGTGYDTLFGGTGDDVLYGGRGLGLPETASNFLRGDDGNDKLYGDLFFDELDGGAGNDTMTGGAAGDLFVASAGADLITDFNVAQGDQIRIGSGVTYTLSQNGADTLVTLSSGGTITLSGVTSSTLTSSSISSSATGEGPLKPGTVDPNAPRLLNFSTVTAEEALSFKKGDYVSLPNVPATSVTAIYGPSTISLTMGDRTVTFSSELVSNVAFNYTLPNGALFLGWDRNDYFSGSGSNDAAFGGPGSDILEGGAGHNLLQGNQGADKLSAAGGNDTMYGGQDDDQLIMGQGANFGQGNKGNDSIFAGDGIDTLLGGQDNDSIVGGGGNDFINGNLGNDSIQAGGGADTIYGEGGNDTLEFDEGADLFRIVAGTGQDRILDFHYVEGDRIVLDRGVTYTASQSGADVVVNIAGGDQLFVVGVQLSTLTGDWISATG